MIPSGKTYCSTALGDLFKRLRRSIDQDDESFLNVRAERGVHFFVGDPPLSPPTVRGSVLLRLAPTFLSDNQRNFLVGRVVDLDGVKFGHLPPLPDTVSASYLKLGSTLFTEICQRLGSMEPHAWLRFSRVRECDPALELLKDVLPGSLLNYMRAVDSYHARAFEYELDDDFELRPEHVVSLHVPEPYIVGRDLLSLIAILGSKVRTYNPKYGLEAIDAYD